MSPPTSITGKILGANGLPLWIPAALLAGLVGGAIQAAVPVGRDSAYFIYILERLLDGTFALGWDAPIYWSYLQFSNFWLYLPAVALFKWLGVPYGGAIFIETFTLYLIASVYMSSLFGRLFGPRVAAGVVLAVGLLYLVFTVDWFAERDQLVFACLLPYVLSAVARAEDMDLPSGRSWPLIALTTAAFLIKPHYALVWVVLEMHHAWRRRSVRVLFNPLNLIVATVTSTYYGYVFYEFFVADGGQRTLFLKYYFSQGGNDLFQHLYRKYSFIWIIVLATWFLARGSGTHRKGSNVLVLAWAAALAGGLAQNGMDYHLFPAAGFALLSILWSTLVLGRDQHRTRRLLAAGLAAVAVLLFAGRTVSIMPSELFKARQVSALSAAVARHADGGPILWLRSDFYPMYPVILATRVRQASRFFSFLFVPAMSVWSRAKGLSEPPPTDLEKLAAAVREDFRTFEPRLIVTSGPDDAMLAPLFGRPEVAALLAGFEEVETVEGYRFLVRAARKGGQ